MLAGLPFPSFTLPYCQIRDWNKERGVCFFFLGGGGILCFLIFLLLCPFPCLQPPHRVAAVLTQTAQEEQVPFWGWSLSVPPHLWDRAEAPGVCCSPVPAVVLRLMGALMSCSSSLTLHETGLSRTKSVILSSGELN